MNRNLVPVTGSVIKWPHLSLIESQNEVKYTPLQEIYIFLLCSRVGEAKTLLSGTYLFSPWIYHSHIWENPPPPPPHRDFEHDMHDTCMHDVLNFLWTMLWTVNCVMFWEQWAELIANMFYRSQFYDKCQMLKSLASG